jgi:hypothetical protein
VRRALPVTFSHVLICRGNHWSLAVYTKVSEDKYFSSIIVLVADSRSFMLVLDSFKQNDSASIPEINLNNLNSIFGSADYISLDVRPHGKSH